MNTFIHHEGSTCIQYELRESSQTRASQSVLSEATNNN